MMSRAVCILTICVVGCGQTALPTPKPSAPPQLKTVDLVELVEQSVIVLDVTGPQGRSMGSGFIVSEDGQAITNVHVLRNATTAIAKFSTGRTAPVIGVRVFDEDLDIAIIQIGNVAGLKPLKLAADLPRKGEATLAFGAPNMLEFTATDGIVSAVRGKTELHPGWPKASNLIQTSAAISPGNSGGPLVNTMGEVVGINTFVMTTGQNLNFAVSAIDAKGLLALQGNQVFPLPLRTTKGVSDEADADALALRLAAILVGQLDERKKELDAIAAEVELTKERIKSTMIEGDVTAESNARRELNWRISGFHKAKKRPFQFPDVSSARPTKGEIGVISPSSVRMVQIIDNAQGQCLVAANKDLIELRGIDLDNANPGDVVDLSDLVFAVEGQRTYETRSGGSNTVFVFSVVATLSKLNDILMKVPPPDPAIPPLTDAERAQQSRIAEEKRSIAAEMLRKEREAARARADEIDRKKRVTEAETLAAQRLEFEKKAETKLELAQKFFDKKEKPAAKKWLTAVVKEFPGTPAAEKAQAMLKSIE